MPTHTDKYLAFDSNRPICYKKSVAKTLLRRADCLPSSFDSKTAKKKFFSNVLKANACTKLFSVTAKHQLQLVALLMKGNQRLVLLLFLTFRVLRNPSREFWIATTLKLLKNLLSVSGIFLPNLRILSRKNNEPTPFILFLAMTVITNTGADPIIFQGKRVDTIVVTFNTNGVEGEWRPRASGASS